MSGGEPITHSGGAGVISGEVLAQVSRSLVQMHKECYGKGPTKARTYASGDLVVCILEGGFTRSERTLREHGREDAVQDQREALQEALRQRFIETVETLLDRKVVTFISGVESSTETSAEVFLLEPSEPDLGDEHEAVASWGAQVRRQARFLRREQAELREEQASARERRREIRDSER